MECTSTFSARVALPPYLCPEIRTSTLVLLPYCRPTGGFPTPAFVFSSTSSTRRLNHLVFWHWDTNDPERRRKLQNEMSSYHCHTIFNCAFFFFHCAINCCSFHTHLLFLHLLFSMPALLRPLLISDCTRVLCRYHGGRRFHHLWRPPFFPCHQQPNNPVPAPAPRASTSPKHR